MPPRRSRGAKTAKDLRKHATRRANQRFGIVLTQNEVSAITRKIQRHEAKFYDRQSGNVTRWTVDLKGTTVAVVYDKKRKCIRTVMPVEYLARTPQESALADILYSQGDEFEKILEDL